MGNSCSYFNTADENKLSLYNDYYNYDDYYKFHEDDTPASRELRYLLFKKYRKINIALKVTQITDEEFYRKLSNNPVYYRIINKLTEKLKLIPFDRDIMYANMKPFKITNNCDGETQYFKGSFNKNGECSGEGIWLNDYNIYYGNFRNDLFNGKGVFMNPKGDFYFGEWINGFPNGRGMIVYNGMVSYDGCFVNGQRSGKGVEKFPDGEIYMGDFSNGQKNGIGKYVFTDGNVYEGCLKNSKFDGNGTYIWRNGQKYIGEFNNGKMNGQGTFSWKDGSVFSGSFNNNLKQGEGEYVWPDGTSYQGNWINDTPSGNGTLNVPRIGFKENISYRNGMIFSRID